MKQFEELDPVDPVDPVQAVPNSTTTNKVFIWNSKKDVCNNEDLSDYDQED
jgi:hypothetical protein